MIRFLAILIGTWATAVGVDAAYLQTSLSLANEREVLRAIETSSNLPRLPSETRGMFGATSATLQEVETKRLLSLVRSFGYLEARLGNRELDGGYEKAGAHVVTIRGNDGKLNRLQLNLGPVYRIGWIDIAGLGSGLDSEAQAAIHELLPTATGREVRSHVLFRLEEKITWVVRNASHPFAKVTARELVPDHESKTAGVRISVDIGPAARLGPVTFEGMTPARAELLNDHVRFAPGARYTDQRLSSVGERLRKLPFVGALRVQLAEVPDPSGLVPVHVEITEKPIRRRAHHTLPGLITMQVTLAALALRQIAVAADISPRIPPMKVLTTSVTLLLLATAWFVAERILAFANLA